MIQKTTAHLTRLAEWRKQRLANYAHKKRIPLTDAIAALHDVFAERSYTRQELLNELDSVCDPEFHHTRQPKQ